MAILRIRDKDGNVQEILAIKGEDGKDYVLTEKDKQEIAAMISASAVAPVDIDTSDFALKTDIPDVSGFALKTEIPDVSGFALKTDIPNVSGYALKADIPDVSGFAKKTEIPSVPTKVSAFTNDAGYLTQHQSLADYAKKSEIPDVSGFATKSEIPDVSNFAKKTDIPDVSGYTTMGAVEAKGYQTATQVQALINTAVAGQTTEAWTFTLEDGSTVTKTVVLK